MENVIIIGGGPAGLAAAVYNARADLKPLVFAGSPPGGQLTLTTEVENFPGFESILGPDLVEKMRAQAQKFGTRIINENILKVDFSKRPLEIYLSNKSYKSHSILIATGAKALWLGLDSEQRLRGKGVSACATCDGFFFRDKTVAVVGGGDTALEEATVLTKFAKKVYIIHRRNSFKASKIMQERTLKNQKVEVIWNTVVEEVLGENRVEGIKLKSQNSKLKTTTQILKLDGLFIAIGHRPDTDLFKGQINLDQKGYIMTFNRWIEDYFLGKTSIDQKRIKEIRSLPHIYRSDTSVAGVFAAGDCVDYVYRQAATAAGMGVAAALDIEKYLEETK